MIFPRMKLLQFLRRQKFPVHLHPPLTLHLLRLHNHNQLLLL